MGSFSALQLSFRYFVRTLPLPLSLKRKVTGGGMGQGLEITVYSLLPKEGREKKFG